MCLYIISYVYSVVASVCVCVCACACVSMCVYACACMYVLYMLCMCVQECTSLWVYVTRCLCLATVSVSIVHRQRKATLPTPLLLGCILFLLLLSLLELQPLHTVLDVIENLPTATSSSDTCMHQISALVQ